MPSLVDSVTISIIAVKPTRAKQSSQDPQLLFMKKKKKVIGEIDAKTMMGQPDNVMGKIIIVP